MPHIVYKLYVIVNVHVPQFPCNPTPGTKALKQVLITATVFGNLNKTPYSKQAKPITKSDLNAGRFTNSLATYLMYCRPWSIKGMNDSPITVFATVSDLVFFPRSRSTSILDLATFNTLERNSVFCINSGMPNSSLTAKSKDRNISQSHSDGRQSRDTILRSRRCRKLHI